MDDITGISWDLGSKLGSSSHPTSHPRPDSSKKFASLRMPLVFLVVAIQSPIVSCSDAEANHSLSSCRARLLLPKHASLQGARCRPSLECRSTRRDPAPWLWSQGRAGNQHRSPDDDLSVSIYSPSPTFILCRSRVATRTAMVSTSD